jgi:succinate dehydrogenase / fumarate reductase, cytochrome b subunit
MATTTIERGQPGSKALFKDSYLLHKLHSLSGVIPIGAFLIFHLTINSYSLGLSGDGASAFNTAVKAISYAPFVILLELGAIMLPILFHAVYGLMIVAELPGPGGNTSHYGYGRNKLYLFQRWSGVAAVLYICYHVYDTTILKYTWELTTSELGPFSGHEVSKELGFQSISYRAMAWRFADPVYLGLYLLGIASACLHLGNGVLNFCIRWGLTIGKEAQKIAAIVGWGLGIALTLLGSAVAINFSLKGQEDHRAFSDRKTFVQKLAQDELTKRAAEAKVKEPAASQAEEIK